MATIPRSVLAAAFVLFAAGCGDASGSGLGWHDGTPTGDDGNGADPSGGGGSGEGSSSTTSSGSTTTNGGGGSTTNGGGSGTTGTSGTNNTTQPAVDVALDKTQASTDLMMKTSTTLTLTPKNGATGAVTLAATGATATFTPSTVTLSGTTPVTVKVDLDAPSAVGTSSVKITATAGAAVSTATLSLTVNPKITFFIPNNAQNSPNVFGIPTYTVTMPTISTQTPLTVVVTNLDASRDHVIHANGVNGFAHGDTGNPLGLNESMTRMVTGKGNYPFYLHDLSGTNPSTTLKIQ